MTASDVKVIASTLDIIIDVAETDKEKAIEMLREFRDGLK